jgi:hypothetical protein
VSGLGWQDLVAGVVALAALAWLARGWWRRRHRGAARLCDACPVNDPDHPDAWQAPRRERRK